MVSLACAVSVDAASRPAGLYLEVLDAVLSLCLLSVRWFMQVPTVQRQGRRHAKGTGLALI